MMKPAEEFLRILTERFPPPHNQRHALLLIDGVLCLSMWIDVGDHVRIESLRFDGEGDLEKSPQVAADEITELLEASPASCLVPLYENEDASSFQ